MDANPNPNPNPGRDGRDELALADDIFCVVLVCAPTLSLFTSVPLNAVPGVELAAVVASRSVTMSRCYCSFFSSFSF